MEPRSKKILTGCAMGCGGLLLIFIGACISLYIWINRPGELLEPTVLLGHDTTGYIEWTLSLDDPGTQDFVEHLLTVWRDLNNQRDDLLPDVLRPLMAFNNERNEKQVLELFPLLTAWTMHPDETSTQADLHLFTVGVENFGNRLKIVDWMLGMIASRSPEIQVTSYAGEKIFRLEDTDEGIDVTAFIRSPNIFFVSTTGTAQQAIDRLEDRGDHAADRTPTAFDGVFATLPVDQPLRGVISNQNHELERLVRDSLPLLDRRLPEGLVDSTGFLSLACSFVNSKDIACRFEIIWKDGIPEDLDIETVDAALEAIFLELELQTTHQTTSQADRMLLDVKIEGLAQLVKLSQLGG